MYAIIAEGGKQYSVRAGDLIDVELRTEAPGATVELDQVLAVVGDGDVAVGAPTVAGAKVVAEVVHHARDRKIIVFKYKRKVRYRKKQGHRQHFTRLKVTEVLSGDRTAAEA